ncbi:MAG: LD-carboxypeptidase [Candidatus Marinimicrobia bacterium]|nr:LD-carboxypeptidase [Candidatus Neomarinimicrobiota bacterium]
MYLLPKSLKSGDTIGVIAPASAAHRKNVALGIDYLKKRGYNIKIAPNLTRGKFYLAGSDNLRTQTLENFILDPEIDGIICVRGGYGLLRIIDRIDYDRLKKVPPKIIVGYSDITALQMAILNKLGWVTYTGPMVAPDMGNNFDPFSEKWLWEVINNHPYPLTLQNPDDEKMAVFRHGTAEGILIGGCLSLITPLLGTPYVPSFKDAILLIEDIGEKTYRLDKQLHILRLHGVLDQISGLLVGHFIDSFPKNPKRSFTLSDLLRDVTGNYDFPIISNVAYGHIRRRWTLPLGARVRMETDPVKITILGV